MPGCPGMDGEAGRHQPWKGVPEKVKNIPAFPAEALAHLTSHKVQHIHSQTPGLGSIWRLVLASSPAPFISTCNPEVPAPTHEVHAGPCTESQAKEAWKAARGSPPSPKGSWQK